MTPSENEMNNQQPKGTDSSTWHTQIRATSSRTGAKNEEGANRGVPGIGNQSGVYTRSHETPMKKNPFIGVISYASQTIAFKANSIAPKHIHANRSPCVSVKQKIR